MNSLAVKRFAQIVGSEARGFASDAVIRGFATDNREVRPGDLFLAIKGVRVDGHEFVADAVRRGAVGALVERPVSGPHVLVGNLVGALARLALHFRDTFDGPVIGVTGSAGKTTTKEFIAAALSPFGPVLKTAGNRNTEYTAPLIWAELEVGVQRDGGQVAFGEGGQVARASMSSEENGLEACGTRAVVVEMAMRGYGQIRHLAGMSKPNIGVITNIGYSHMSEVGSREGIAEAKAELLQSLPPDGVAVLWQEDPYLHFLRSKTKARVVTFGYSEEADCRITSYKATSWTSSTISGVCLGVPFTAELPAVGRHIALGAAAALAVAASATGKMSGSGILPEVQRLEASGTHRLEGDATWSVPLAAAALRTAQLPPMRMEVVDLNGATVLLDTYNAAPPSMLAAIETFAELPCAGRRLAVIGEMRELGTYADAAHREVGRALASSGIDQAIFYSGPAALAAEESRMHGLVGHLAESLDDIAAFLRQAQGGDAVLVKGSRSLELERAVDMARQPLGAGC